MDNREQVLAANALIEWFNGQEIHMADASMVMAKVIAKIIISKVGWQDRQSILDLMDATNLAIAHELNDRIVAVARGKADAPKVVPPKRRPINEQ